MPYWDTEYKNEGIFDRTWYGPDDYDCPYDLPYDCRLDLANEFYEERFQDRYK